MLISHRCQFIIFTDPLKSCQWLQQTLSPWSDQPVAPAKKYSDKSLFFNGMSPAEAELAFDLSGLPFHNYTRIAVVQNPFRRMAQLYDRIKATDPLWRLRKRAGLDLPDFGAWLEKTRPDGNGAGFIAGPRWRKYGAWSADAWGDGRITNFVRAETVAEDLRGVFRQMGVAPVFGDNSEEQEMHRFAEMLRYDATTMEIIRDRYRSDLNLYQKPAPKLRLVA